MKPLVERFWSKVDKSGACWLWTGALDHGYGRIREAGKGSKLLRANCASWLLAYGEIPVGMCVCHECDNPKCVRPSHLFLGTSAENTADRHRKGRDARGLAHGQTRLSPRAELETIQLLSDGWKQWDIARRLGVSQATISRININGSKYV